MMMMSLPNSMAVIFFPISPTPPKKITLTGFLLLPRLTDFFCFAACCTGTDFSAALSFFFCGGAFRLIGGVFFCVPQKLRELAAPVRAAALFRRAHSVYLFLFHSIFSFSLLPDYKAKGLNAPFSPFLPLERFSESEIRLETILFLSAHACGQTFISPCCSLFSAPVRRRSVWRAKHHRP